MKLLCTDFIHFRYLTLHILLRPFLRMFRQLFRQLINLFIILVWLGSRILEALALLKPWDVALNKGELILALLRHRLIVIFIPPHLILSNGFRSIINTKYKLRTHHSHSCRINWLYYQVILFMICAQPHFSTGFCSSTLLAISWAGL